MVDITRALQCIVESSRLVLWEVTVLLPVHIILFPLEGSKSSLPGVWDPCPGEPDKRILVEYTYKGAAHTLLCPEEEAVKLPKTSHKLSEEAVKLPKTSHKLSPSGDKS